MTPSDRKILGVWWTPKLLKGTSHQMVDLKIGVLKQLPSCPSDTILQILTRFVSEFYALIQMVPLRIAIEYGVFKVQSSSDENVAPECIHVCIDKL